MKVLGICHDVIICSACVVEDGKVLTAMAEERLDRVKQSRVFPTLSINDCLQRAGLTMSDIDEIAIAWNPAIDAQTIPGGFLNARRSRTEHFAQVPARLLAMSGKPPTQMVSQTNLWDGAPPITYIDHYLAHVGNAVYLSPYDSCAVAVLDGRGEKQTSLLARANGTKLEVIEEVAFPHSLGLFYGAVTQFLGFRPDSDEWKVMALASYGDTDNEFVESMRKMISVDERGRLSVELQNFEFFNHWDRRMYSDQFVSVFGIPRLRDDEIMDRHRNIASALQTVFEEVMTSVLTRLHERSGEDRLVVSGGCFMNSVFNGKITTVTPFKECFITSCPDDSGTSIGAALHVCAQRTGKRAAGAPDHNYWGPEFSDAECLEVATGFKIPNTTPVDDPGKAAAADLVEGKLVGWFQGPAEFGQRALGARSILCDARRDDAKDLINAAVKFREGFRPFAPAILVEHVHEYFECDPDTRVPYMERVLQFREEKKAEVAAVVHVDGSGRLQTVDANSNPRYRGLIQHFNELTSVPVVLNTSFNLNGEPIVHTPQDAIRTFYSCGLDVLYLGNVRISK